MIRIIAAAALCSACLLSVASAATRVTVAPLKDFLIFPEQSAAARVISLNEAKISALISGQIQTISVRAGESVTKGETLIQLDCRDARLAHQAATARLSLAQKDAKRARALKKSNNIAEQIFNQALTEEIQADINEKQTALQVQRCEVTAPFNGVVLRRLSAVGERAAPGTPLLDLLDTDAVELSASVPQPLLTSVTRARTLQFRVNGNDYPTTLRKVLPQLEPTSQDQEIRLTFTGAKALPGSSGRLHWTLATPHIVPKLLSQRDDKTGIFLARDGKAVFQPLKNALIGHPAATTLPPDTRVIVDGRFSLKPGDAIEIVQ